MSAIAGILRFDGQGAGMQHIEAITSAMAHRGAYGVLHWNQGPIALGLCRANPATRTHTDPERETTGFEGLRIVADARIDNRPDLRRQLASVDSRGLIDSDAGLILAAYLKWGDRCPEHLLGDFVFAIWDQPRQTLFLARDAIGARSLCWLAEAHSFAFASEEEALLARADPRCIPNEARLGSILIPGFLDFDPEESWFRCIHVLQPGCTMTVDPSGKRSSRRYYRLEPRDPLRLRDASEYEEAFRTLLVEAVRCRLQSNLPAGLMLSGGVDSLSVFGAAKLLESRGEIAPLHTWSLVSEDPGCQESERIRAATQGRDDLHHAIRVPLERTAEGRPAPPFEQLHHVLWEAAHPVPNSVPAVQCIAWLASLQGHATLLSGVNGDLTLFSPTFYMDEHLRRGRFVWVLREAALAQRHGTYLRGVPTHRLLARLTWQAFAPRSARIWRARRQLQAATASPLWHLLSDQARRELTEHAQNRLAAEHHGPARSEAEHHAHALRTGSLQCGLEGYGRTCLRRGIDHADPWSDLRLVEFCQALPADQKAGQGWTKRLARSACSSWLPDNVLWGSDKIHLGHYLAELAVECAPPLRRPTAGAAFQGFRALAARLESDRLSGYPREGLRGPDALIASAALAWLIRTSPLP